MKVDEFELMRFEKYLLYNDNTPYTAIFAMSILEYIKNNPNVLPQEITDTVITENEDYIIEDAKDSIIEEACDNCEKIEEVWNDGILEGKAEGIELTLNYLSKIIKKEITDNNSILQLLENMNVYDLI